MTKPDRPPPAPPPTLAHLREHNGVEAARIHCVRCGRAVDVPFTALGLPDDTPFPEVARRWRRPCGKCGAREVAVSPVFPAR